MAVPKPKTKVTNVTSASRFYPYLGVGGRTLAAAASYTVDGDLRQTLASDKRKARLLAAFDADVTNKKVGVTVQVESDPGAPNGTGVTAAEMPGVGIRRTVLTFTNVAMALTDVAATVAFALDNRAITGTTLLVDGGQHLMKFERDFSLM